MLSRLRARRQEGAADPSAAPVDLGADALAFLLTHGVSTSPRYYALVHTAMLDRTSVAAHAIAEATANGARFNQEPADAILTSMSPREAGEEDQAAEEHERLRHQTLHLADLAADAQAVQRRFGDDLTSGLSDLDNDVRSVTAVLTAMIDRTRSTEAKLAAAVQQIEQLRDEVAEARSDAMRDELTGLLNRRGVLDHLASLATAKPRTVAICDIDAFKAINDGHGHEVGDRVLKVAAETLAKACAPHLVGRWGGEEFIVLLDEADPVRAAEIIDDARIDLAARQLKVRETGAKLGMVTFSAGVTSFAEPPIEPALRAADALLYQAKLSGRNKVLTEMPPAQAA